jgi:hypothetical protein
LASVTDSSLRAAAQDIVSEYLENGVSLNEGVTKKASEIGLNQDQTARLIERTNTEAFLRVFPESTEFEVASPEVVLGIKTASVKTARVAKHADDCSADEGLFKAASVQKEASAPRKHRSRVDNISAEDIFGMDEEFLKVAAETAYDSAIDKDVRMMHRAFETVTKTASELARENLDREMRFSEAITGFMDHIKQASLAGTQSIASSEAELLNMYPEESNLIRNIYDEVTIKMAHEVEDARILERAKDVIKTKFAHESQLTNKFQKILDIIQE